MSWYTQTEEAQKHIKECKGCEKCIWIEESAWTMRQTHEEMDQKKNQPKPQVKTKSVYNYRLKEWRNEVIK